VKAHQRLIREKRAAEDADADMFGRWWQGINLDLANADVREVSYETAKSIIEKYEWLGTMPAICRHQFGIFFDGCCGGVVVYGDEYAENLGVWDKYGFTGRIICLSRGACVHWSPVGAASRLIRRSMALLPTRYEVITATTDFEAGEIGTIYQACGFHAVNMNTHSRYQSVGVTSRALRGKGIKNKRDIIAAGGDPKVEHKKGRYFCFRGPRAVTKRHLAAIAHLIQPYPKRAEQVSSRDTAGTPCKAGGSSPAPLQVVPIEPE
jgi:hypothetical protein